MQPLTDVNSPEDQVLLKGITGDRSLSATSKKAYAMRLRLLASKRRKPILDIILEADQSLAWLRQKYIEVCTRTGFISAVLAAVRRCPPKFALRLQKAQQLWLQELSLLDRVLQQRYKSNLPTARPCAMGKHFQVARQTATWFQSQAVALHVQPWNGAHACRLQPRCSAELLW